MTVLFGTAKSNYPDFGETNGVEGVAQFENRAKLAVEQALSALGAKTFQSSFVEDGVRNVPGTSFIDSKFNNMNSGNRRKIQTQHTQATVMIKKRMFSTLRANYDARFMDNEERIFLRAIKCLFKRKCEQISFYENLIVLEKIIEDPSFLTSDSLLDQMLGGLFTVLDIGFGLDSAETLQGQTVASADFMGDGTGNILSMLMKLRDVNERAKQNKFTTWITNPRSKDISLTGAGVGVIELTLVTSLSTTVALKSGAGRCNLQIEDPYQLTRITEADIDFALKQALAEEDGFPAFFDVRSKQLVEQVKKLDAELNVLRRERRVSEVNFEFPFNSKKNIIANLVNINLTFTMDSFDKLNNLINAFSGNGASVNSSLNNIPEEESFTGPELIRVRQVFTLLEEYKAIQDMESNAFQEQNELFKPIRKKMRNEFVGHHIIQQMDSAHVYINSFKRDEAPVSIRNNDAGGFLAKTISSMEEQTGFISAEFLEQERQVLAPQMPAFLYNAIRNPINFRGTGPQVFSGIVNTISCSYTATNGKYTLSVGVVDNMEHLKLSRVNTQPSLSQPAGVLEDPLTPYDIVTDPTSGLVISRKLSNTNIKRIENNLLTYDDYPLLGEKVKDENELIYDTARGGSTNLMSYRHIPGLVYKWKDGILAMTKDVSMTKTLDGKLPLLADIKEDFGLTLSNDPFSNLDAADIISILVTGRPHNYNTFVQDAVESGNLSLDNDLNSSRYFNYLFDILEQRNSTNGSFIPAKNSGIDPAITAGIIKQQRKLLTSITKINDAQAKMARLEGNLRAMNDDGAQVEGIREALRKEIELLSSDVEKANKTFSDSLANTKDTAGIRVIGDSVQVHFEAEDTQSLNRRLNYQLKRKPEDVRYNQDRNYFVVSDKYDSDTDIQAFSTSLRSGAPNLFEDTLFKTPFSICVATADVIDFEFFADSQGNLNFRPPEYNKTPLSLMLKMIELGRNDGVSIAPDFLLKLVASRVDLVKDNLFATDLKIMENIVLLGTAYSPDIDIGVNLTAVEQTDGSIVFVENQVLIDVKSSEIVFGAAQQGKLAFARVSAVESEETRAKKIIQIRNKIGAIDGTLQYPMDDNNNADVAIVTEEFKQYNSQTNINAASNRLRLTNKIAQLVSEHQRLISLYSKLSTENAELKESESLLSPQTSLRVPLYSAMVDINPAQRDTPVFPKFLEGLIENDISNDDGFNSGKRFIIQDSDILSMNFSISTPEFNRIDVNGSQNLVGDLRSAHPLMFLAGAVDFDSWRQFGYRSAVSVNKAFFQNAETQCAPYATFLLLRERRKVHSGNIIVLGNEFYQAGDVVYVNCRQMLYYVDSVNHTFDYTSGRFNTNLTLSFGRALGEYIPTPLDIIGKTLISNQKQSFGNLKAVRRSVPASHVIPLETLFIPVSVADTSNPFKLSIMTAFVEKNKDKIKNAIVKASARLNQNNQDNTRVELRGYYIDSDVVMRGKIAGYMNEARKMLINGAVFEKPTTLGEDITANLISDTDASGLVNGLQSIPSQKVDPNNYILAINKDLSDADSEFRRMPTQEAWALGSDTVYNQMISLPINSIDIVLVIDKSRNGDRAEKTDVGQHSVGTTEPVTVSEIE